MHDLLTFIEEHPFAPSIQARKRDIDREFMEARAIVAGIVHFMPDGTMSRLEAMAPAGVERTLQRILREHRPLS